MGLKFRILAKTLDDAWFAEWQGKSFLKFLFYMLKFMKKYDMVEINYYKK